MSLSFKSAKNFGIGFFLVIIMILGSVPFILGSKLFDHLRLTRDNLSELNQTILMSNGLLSVRELFDRFIKADLKQVSPMADALDRIVESASRIIQEDKDENAEAKNHLQNIVLSARQSKAIIFAYAEEAAIDASGDNALQLENLSIQTLMRANQQLSEHMSEHSIQEIQAALAQIDKVTLTSRNVTLVVFLISILIGISLAFIMARALKKPIYQLIEGTQKLSAGHLEYRVSQISDDEIGELAVAFNQMAEDLENRTQTLEQQIKKRINTESALRESERKYRRILENMEEAYFEADLDGNLQFFNQKLIDYTRYSADSAAHMNLKQFLDETSVEQIFKAFNQVYFSGKPLGPIAARCITANGAVMDVNISISLIRKKESGKRIGYRGLIWDVTEQRKMEVRLQRAQKMESIGMLAGGVAHDLNNILSGIVSYPELLLLDLPPDSPMIKPIETIKKSGEKASAIVQDLLTLARRGVVSQEVVNLNDIISEFLESVEFDKIKMFYPEVHFRTQLDPGLLNILGSQVHLSKTLLNLTSNAVEAMPRGGEVIISTKNRYVDYPIAGYEQVAEGDYAVMTIEDQGEGIQPDDLNKIFEPFYTKKTMGKSGTGLGMAVVWGTVKDHRGYIDAHSRPGEGTKFNLYFPITRKQAGQVLKAHSVEEYRGNGESILVVDDVEEQRKIASELLGRLSYAVTAVSSGEEAVTYLKQHRADLLVLDMIMDPGIDGLETYRRILDFLPEQKAIISTGFSDTQRIKDMQALGVKAYVKKPYTMERIAMAVKKALNG